MGRLSRLGLGLLAACGLAACGRAAASTPPAPVPLQLAPPALTVPGPTGALSLQLYKPATRTFASAGADSLVADGRLWQMRRGTVLVGTLEIATFKAKVDLTKYSERQQIINLVMPGSFITTQVDGIQVATSSTPDLNIYLWYGKQMFEVLQARTAGADPKAILESVIAYQKPSGLLLPASLTSKKRG